MSGRCCASRSSPSTPTPDADAVPPEQAEALYERFRRRLGAAGGVFGADMEVELVNDGPVTLLLEIPAP